MLGSEGNLQVLALSFYHVGPGNLSALVAETYTH